jgi:uncharacterized membrane protein YfcA
VVVADHQVAEAVAEVEVAGNGYGNDDESHDQPVDRIRNCRRQLHYPSGKRADRGSPGCGFRKSVSSDSGGHCNRIRNELLRHARHWLVRHDHEHLRHWRLVPDEIIPGTLNVGHTLPAIVQAFIFIRIVPVDGRTLALMIAAAVSGAWLGAGVVAGLPRRQVQLGMGAALFGAAIIMSMALLSLVPGGGSDLSLAGSRLIVAVLGNFLLGALMTLGIGLYAPCMILVSLLGMNPTAAFPIMMGSCAFLMPVASARFIRARSYSPRISLGLLVGGIPAVLIAAFIVKSLPLTAIRFLVVIVVLYTSAGLIESREARTETSQRFTTECLGAEMRRDGFPRCSRIRFC